MAGRLAPGCGAFALAAWLLCALVLAQAQGLMHGIVHGHPEPARHGLHAPGALDHGEVGDGRVRDGPGLHWVLRLFSGHGDAPTCRLFDQLGHADCLPGVPALVLPLQPAPRFVDIFEAQQPSLPPALIQARSPPPVR